MAATAIATPRRNDLERLFIRWRRDGDEGAREALVLRFMPLTRSLARRYENSSEPYEDLLQVASLGLLKALDRFEPERGRPFPSFAIPTILGEMRRYFRDSGWSIHVPRGVQERALKVRDAQDDLTSEQGRAPTVTQLAARVGLNTEQVIDALQAIHAYEAISLDSPPPSAEDGHTASYDETLGEEDERYELIELDATVAAALHQLPARGRLILRLRFVEDLTQTEIAKRLGVSQMHVSRLLRRTLEQLRALTTRRPGTGADHDPFTQ